MPLSQILLTTYGIYLLYIDYQTNRNNSVIKLPYFKWILLYTSYLCILTIFQGTTFKTYNNAFFIIHSVLFFLIMLIYCEKDLWEDSLKKIILLFICILSLFSVATTIIFIITNTELINYINSKSFKEFLLYVAPTGKRVLGLMTNENTYSYLLLYTFYLYIYLIIIYKKTKLQYLLIGLIINNFFNLFIVGSRGSILTLFISGTIFSFLLLILMSRFSYNNMKYYLKFIIFFFLSFLLFIFIIYKTNYKLSIILKDFIDNNLIRKWNLKLGSGRLLIWKTVFSIDKNKFLFGVSDIKMYELIKDNLPYYSRYLLNNNGRYHNLYITLIANYGIIALLGFIIFIIYSIRIFINVYFNSNFNQRRIILVISSQFLTFLISGIFEQLPLFNLSPHTLLFMLTWSALFKIANLERM
ncbi:hypothetical protein EOM09_02665 [bacterium]|nr:hypothetical protein [bacterium]